MKISNITLILFLLIISCTINQEKVEGEGSRTKDKATDQPQLHETMSPFIFKTSEPEMVTITGELIVLDPSVMLPDPNDGIFLVRINQDSGNITSIPLIDHKIDYRAEVDERNGEFVFTNIQPGLYAVVILTTNGFEVPAHFYQDNGIAFVDLKESDRDQVINLDYLSIP